MASVIAVKREMVAIPVRQTVTLDSLIAPKNVIQCAESRTPVRADFVLKGVFLGAKRGRKMVKNNTAAIPVRQQTNAIAGRLMRWPKIAVKANTTT